LFGGEFYTGSKTGAHTCLRRVLYWFKGRSSYLCGGEFYTGSKVGVHTCEEESFILVQRQEFILEESFILVQR
jgi:hypothetical protein